MASHWTALVDQLCDLRGSFTDEFTAIEKANEVARGYIRDLRFPILLQELDDDLLTAASLEADGLLTNEAGITCYHSPSVMALTYAAYALLHGEADNGSLGEEMELSCRRVAAFVLLEKMRRLNVYDRMSLPFDPWDDETPVICDGVHVQNEKQFKRFLGYVEED